MLYTSVLCGLLGCSGGSAKASLDEPNIAGHTVVSALAAASPTTLTVAGTVYRSSTKLGVTWSAPAGSSIVHYAVTWTDQTTGVAESANSTTPTLTLSDLKTATSYKIDVVAAPPTRASKPSPSR